MLKKLADGKDKKILSYSDIVIKDVIKGDTEIHVVALRVSVDFGVF